MWIPPGREQRVNRVGGGSDAVVIESEMALSCTVPERFALLTRLPASWWWRHLRGRGNWSGCSRQRRRGDRSFCRRRRSVGSDSGPTPGAWSARLRFGLPRELDVEGLLSEAATLLKVAELEDGRRARSTPNAPSTKRTHGFRL